jgi:WD40 repeat protein
MRGVYKQGLAQKLHNEERIDLALCAETVDVLEAALFGGAQKKTESPLPESLAVTPATPADARNGETPLKLQHVRIFDGGTSAFSPDGKRVVSVAGKLSLKLWETESGELVRAFAAGSGGHTDQILSVAFSPDGKYIASGAKDTALKLWETESGNLVRTFIKQKHWVVTVLFTPDGSSIATVLRDGAMRQWEVKSGKSIHSFSLGIAVYSVSYSPDGKYLALGSRDGNCKQWEASGKGRLNRIFFGAGEAVSYSPDSKRLVTGSNKTLKIKLWETEGARDEPAQLIRAFEGYKNSIHSVAFSNDGNHIVAVGDNNIVKQWEAASGRLIFATANERLMGTVAFSPDGKHIVSDGVLWRLEKR